MRNKITDSNYGYKHFYGNSFAFKEFVSSEEPTDVESGDPWDSVNADPFGDVPNTPNVPATSTKPQSESPFEDDLFG